MSRLRYIVILLAIATLSSCVGGNTSAEYTPDSDTVKTTVVSVVPDSVEEAQDSTLQSLSPQQIDSLAFRLTHHYSENFNFKVKVDSLTLIPHLGDILQDTCTVYDGELLVVAAIDQATDTVWVKVAHDQMTMGWVPEPDLLRCATPDDPISEILDSLSSSRGIWMSMLAGIGIIAFLIRRGLHRSLHIIDLQEVSSPYPILFINLIALMASLYASVQNFMPEYWQEYYFHPTLNPLLLPPIMALLVVIVWLVIITAIAVVDEVYHNLPSSQVPAYMLELIGLSMIVYLIISTTTLFYIGYILLIAFITATTTFYIKKR